MDIQMLELNMNRLLMTFTVLVSLIIGGVGGAYYGFQKGVEHYSSLESVVQGALSTRYLAAIDKNKIDVVELNFELNIDMGLDGYERYRKSSNKVFAEYFLSEHIGGLERYVDEMAAYRKDNPVVFDTSWALPKKDDSAEVVTWKNAEIASANKMMANINNVLRERGVLVSGSNK